MRKKSRMSFLQNVDPLIETFFFFFLKVCAALCCITKRNICRWQLTSFLQRIRCLVIQSLILSSLRTSLEVEQKPFLFCEEYLLCSSQLFPPLSSRGISLRAFFFFFSSPVDVRHNIAQNSKYTAFEVRHGVSDTQLSLLCSPGYTHSLCKHKYLSTYVMLGISVCEEQEMVRK